MQLTVNLPDHIAEKVNAYLNEHPDETFYSLVQDALEVKLMPKDSSKLLELAGIVSEAPHHARDHAEDHIE